MTIPASGPISFSQIRNELVLTGSISASDFRTNDAQNWANIPTSGALSTTVFRNKSHYPLRNSATDPTSNDTASNNAYNWRLNSTPSGYTFIANKGIYTDVPITNMRYMFFYKSSFNDADVALWDVSSVTNMEQIFFSCSNLNQNIGNWNVSNVTNMSGMFYYCSSFNQNISNWNGHDVSSRSSRKNV